MPVYKCPNGKFRIGSGKCMYTSKALATKAYVAYKAISHAKEMVLYIKTIVKKAKKAIKKEDTTTAKIAPLVKQAKKIKKKKLQAI